MEMIEAFRSGDATMIVAQLIGMFAMAASPLNFVYCLLIGSVGGVINEQISFTSAVVGIIRYRKKKTENAA